MRRRLRAALLPFGMLFLLAAAAAPPEPPQPNLVDFIAPPGTRQPFQPFMLHADLWVGLDQRVKLDTTVYAIENGARCCRVLKADSLWAVDYTWIYPHSVLPRRWYAPQELMRVGDSIGVPDTAVVRLTFGTCRIGVRATNYAEAHSEALRLWPPVMPPRLAGRLKLKLERAEKALRGGRADQTNSNHE